MFSVGNLTTTELEKVSNVTVVPDDDVKRMTSKISELEQIMTKIRNGGSWDDVKDLVKLVQTVLSKLDAQEEHLNTRMAN